MISSLVGECGFGPSRPGANGSGSDSHVSFFFFFSSWRCASALQILGVLGGNELGPRHPGFFASKWRLGSHLRSVASHPNWSSLALVIR